ncbi:hypothetical protein GCM10009755_06970 [Brevibacterium samyangense]|uniref:HTH luxR-type domain-containing protein n=2 Tax=Brevibacterium samyangense TaxID=366888 RepID=A0ABP5ENY3_9MICO
MTVMHRPTPPRPIDTARRGTSVRFTATLRAGALVVPGRFDTPLGADLDAVLRSFLASGLPHLGFYLVRGRARSRVRVSRASGSRDTCTVEVTARQEFHGLSVQEHRVASLVACGLSNPEIGEALACSRRTVDRHVSNALARLGLQSRSQISTLVALGEGWVAPLPWIPHLSGMLPVLAALTGQDTGAEAVPGPWGASAPVAGPTAPVLRIGSLVPAGEERKLDAVAMARGEDLAAATDLRERPGETRVEITRVRATAADAPRALAELAASGCHAVVLGNFPPPVAVDLLRGTKDLGIPVLHSMVDRRLAEFVGPTRGYDHIFQMCSDETVYVRAFATFVREVVAENGARPASIALLVRRDESAEAKQVLTGLLDLADGHRVHVIEYDDGVNWAGVALELQQLAPDAVYMGVYTETALVSLLQYLRGADVTSHYYCVWVPGIPGFTRRNAALSEGLVWTTLVGNTENWLGTRFRRLFEERFGEDPGIGSAAVHYDMVKLLERAWQQVGGSAVPEDLTAGLQTVQYQGVTGSFHFDGGRRRALCYPFDTDDPTIGQPYLTFRIRDGKSEEIGRTRG